MSSYYMILFILFQTQEKQIYGSRDQRVVLFGMRHKEAAGS